MRRRKDPRIARKERLSLILLTLFSIPLLFAMIVLEEVVFVFILCIFDGFDNFLPQITNLPYLFYLLVSVAICAVLMIIMTFPRKR